MESLGTRLGYAHSVHEHVRIYTYKGRGTGGKGRVWGGGGGLTNGKPKVETKKEGMKMEDKRKKDQQRQGRGLMHETCCSGCHGTRSPVSFGHLHRQL